jgi:hypothetical protein
MALLISHTMKCNTKYHVVRCRDTYISPEQFGGNVRRLMSAGKSAGVQHFLLITPPPVCEVCRVKAPVSGALQLKRRSTCSSPKP